MIDDVRQPTFGNAIWQRERYLELAYDQGASREHLIRTTAKSVVSAPTTYTGGTIVPWYVQPSFDEPLPPDTMYFRLHIALSPSLESHPEEAVLIAEEIIRHQVADIEGKPEREWHRIETPKWTESELDAPFPAKELRLHAQVDDQIIEARQVIDRHRLQRASSAEGMLDHMKRDMAHEFARHIAKALGLEL